MPGSSFADIFMRMAVMELVAEALWRWPLASRTVVVDDVQGTVYGKEDYVRRVTAEVCTYLHDGLIERSLPISEPKHQLVGTTPRLVRKIAGRCRTLAQAAVASVRCIGADFAGGRRIVHRVRARRVFEVLRRLKGSLRRP